MSHSGRILRAYGSSVFAPMRRQNSSGYLLTTSRWNYPMRRPSAPAACLGGDCEPFSPWRISRRMLGLPSTDFERHHHGVAVEAVRHTLFPLIRTVEAIGAITIRRPEMRRFTDCEIGHGLRRSSRRRHREHASVRGGTGADARCDRGPEVSNSNMRRARGDQPIANRCSARVHMTSTVRHGCVLLNFAASSLSMVV